MHMINNWEKSFVRARSEQKSICLFKFLHSFAPRGKGWDQSHKYSNYITRQSLRPSFLLNTTLSVHQNIPFYSAHFQSFVTQISLVVFFLIPQLDIRGQICNAACANWLIFSNFKWGVS